MADVSRRARKRCAIYTRKSSEEGLDQEFNSLQAQREACEAFIVSQKAEGWQVLRASYDDGGWSGGTLDRPALQRLLTDIRASDVDVVVVYKIDRLTRSLFDFAKIVDVFDAHSVSFVSVTQHFNTTTSMGRLTLNVLLSFAQFEREVTGERIRDKIAASKKKGMWVGGFVPLGYEAKDRKLIINKEEAESVRFIFHRYLELGSVYKLAAELDAKGITSKRRLSASGRAWGGCSISAGALYSMLQNPIYCAQIGHKGQTYEGMHKGIIEPALWETVQQSLAANRLKRRNGTNAKEPSLLAGLIVDAEGQRLTPSHAIKRGKRYRYYTSRRLITDPGKKSEATLWRLPAGELERLVLNQIIEFLLDQSRIWDLLRGAKLSHDVAQASLRRADRLARDLPRLGIAVRPVLLDLIKRVIVHVDKIATEISAANLVERLSEGRTSTHDDTIVLTTPCALSRCGMEMRLVIEGAPGASERGADPTLVATITRAHLWWRELQTGAVRTIREIAVREHKGERHVARTIRLAFLAPDITTAILEGAQPPYLTTDALIRMSDLPCSWSQQRKRLGFSWLDN